MYVLRDRNRQRQFGSNDLTTPHQTTVDGHTDRQAACGKRDCRYFMQACVDITVHHTAMHNQGCITQKRCFGKLRETVTKDMGTMFSGYRHPDALEFIRVSDTEMVTYVNVSAHTARQLLTLYFSVA